ncbi:MAG: NAD-binding protein [Melioribacteraceae bacterium]|nr:NAD-binding protein [Melioribacteraceae bacterium]
MPFRDAFSSLFFVSIGMLLDINFLLDNILTAISLSILVLIVKSLVGVSAIKILRVPWRISIIAGLALAQVGEFSFILAKTGLSVGFLSDDFYQKFLAVSILTMSITPVLLKISPIIGDKVAGWLRETKFTPNKNLHKHLEDHLIIIGYGINGRNLARAAKSAKIPFVILETNPETVKEEKAKGTNIIFGDAVYPDILDQANIKKARIMVIAINDPTAVQRIVVQAKDLNPNVFVIVRTRHVKEVESLIELGANEVIPEEFETSIEIFGRVLTKYLIPRTEIENFINEIRSDSYDMFRSMPKDISPVHNLPLHIPELEIISFIIDEKCQFKGKSLSELDLRNKFGFSILAIKRDDEVIGTPTAATVLKEEDVVFILTEHDKISEISELFKS